MVNCHKTFGTHLLSFFSFKGMTITILPPSPAASAAEGLRVKTNAEEMVLPEVFANLSVESSTVLTVHEWTNERKHSFAATEVRHCQLISFIFYNDIVSATQVQR
jgi:hypothetical protein